MNYVEINQNMINLNWSNSDTLRYVTLKKKKSSKFRETEKSNESLLLINYVSKP